MQSENYAQLLDRAARLWRIDPEYWDIWGRKHVTSDETKRAIVVNRFDAVPHAVQ